MAKSGLAWHKRQLSVLRAIIREGREWPVGSLEYSVQRQRFFGAVQVIPRSNTPAFHDPLAKAVKEGSRFFDLEQEEVVISALDWLSREHKRVKNKKAKPAKKAAASQSVGDGETGEPTANEVAAHEARLAGQGDAHPVPDDPQAEAIRRAAEGPIGRNLLGPH